MAQWRDATKQQKSRSPSYLDPRTVSLVVVDTFVPDAALAAGKEDPDQPPSADALAAIGAAVKDVEDPGAREWLARIVADARGDVDAVRTRVEDHFNQLMDRATGWYKREVQVILFVVALAVAGMLNADTINVADRLSRDEAVRAQVVAQAQRAGQGPPPKGTPTAATIERQIEAARATALPLGWGGENVPNGGVIGVVAVKALGLVITAFALMLAAPFWFDVLGKFARLRSTGNRIGTRKDDDLAPTDRDDRTARRSRAGAR